MCNEERNKKYKLYVLRYNSSGNYYVGITQNLKKRMVVHWRRKSRKKGLPEWSLRNESKEGFKFYWFDIEKNVVSQSCADRCENQLAKRLFEKIEDINNEKFNEEIHVGNSKFVDGKESNYDVNITLDNSAKKYIDNKIEVFLKHPIPLSLKKVNEEVIIHCIEIDNIGVYDTSQCNKEWNDIIHGN